MNKLIALSIILALGTATSIAQAAPVSSTQLKILDAQSGSSTTEAVDNGVTSVAPGMSNTNTVLSTQAMTAPASGDSAAADTSESGAADTFESASADMSPAAATFESATSDVADEPVADFDAAMPSLLDDFSDYDFSDFSDDDGASAASTDRVLVSEPGVLLLWLAGLLALAARRRQ